ncbi:MULTISPECIES: FliO/MopB family protein [Pelosinus]|uniref:Flagellar biosynthesis protein, FliO n=1 Tax=Pelosinus fermentans B4 TaxID=1149862 RepID=I9LCY1_9FIRM|nr:MULTISPECIES: flagellar biosynthetic protein FliO [Pelosinus]EIW18201.1 Flagellar biosynthesis protein, FliO [Pelosinus fermentans B4]EIW24005.1 flagellar biosynthetic protein FliO [Pelosinus fermentans A11]OAM94067.1 Flagellar biosynthesis protein, FliO [Pelosinus fermentans DSM 17108]SDQ98837.1 flagellar protein FliO/FliZ [Pelosinus fermentans]
MNKNKYRVFWRIFLLLFCIGIFFNGQVYAAESNGDYLQYQEPKPANSTSWISTVSYVFSLLITFAAVIGLAYFASRFLGKKLGSLSASGSSRVINTLSFGANRAVYTVEIAGKFLVLGVTDHGITVLQEITNPEEIEKMKVEQEELTVPINQFDTIFQKQLASLQRFSQTFPTAFGDLQSKQKHESGKR